MNKPKWRTISEDGLPEQGHMVLVRGERFRHPCVCYICSEPIWYCARTYEEVERIENEDTWVYTEELAYGIPGGDAE